MEMRARTETSIFTKNRHPGMDVFDELSMKAYEEHLLSLSTDIFSGSIDSDGAITSDSYTIVFDTEQHYPQPKNSEALRIWNECRLGDRERESKILRRLSKWAEAQKVLRYDETTHTIYICWKSPSATVYNSTWSVFIKWFLCACT